MRSFLWACLFLSACSRQPIAPERRALVSDVAAVSLLGNDLTVDVASRAFLKNTARVVDVTAWGMDAAFRNLLRAGVESRQKAFRPLEIAPADLAHALAIRESRWRRVTGAQSQALLDLLIREAERQGVRYFFLLTPPVDPGRFPAHHGVYGATCDDRTDKNARASVYFFFDFALWDVAARKKIFAITVDPKVTDMMTFGGCSAVQELKDPARELEDPVRKTMELLVDSLFDKMGWVRPLVQP